MEEKPALAALLYQLRSKDKPGFYFLVPVLASQEKDKPRDDMFWKFIIRRGMENTERGM